VKFFIDTANTDEIKYAWNNGWIDGVTTNPSLIAKSGRDFHEVIKEICGIVDGPVSAEVVSLEADDMFKEGLELAKMHDNVVVKVPTTEQGIIAVKRFSAEGIKTNVTLCFSPLQALMIAKAGGTMVSPFVGRLDDIGHDGMGLVEDIIRMYDQYGFETEVLVASVRSPNHVYQATQMGADIATVPLSVLQQMLKHPLTDIGLEKFMSDWEKAKS
jgi:transaldolase